MAWAPAPVPPAELHPGFVSVESKRRFAIQAFVVCGLVLVVQVGIPTLFAVVSLPVMMLRDGFQMTHLQGAQWYEGQLWYVAQGRSRAPGGGTAIHLNRLELRGTADPVVAATLPATGGAVPRWLVAGSDRLWAVADDGTVVQYRGGTLSVHSPPSPLGAISSPFEYDGQPAVLAASGGLPPSWLALRVFDGGGWPERGRAPYGALVGGRCWPQSFRVVADGTSLHAFVQTDDHSIHYAQIELGTKAPSWEKVAQTRDRWDVALGGGEPTLLFKRIEMWSDQLVVQRRAVPGSWPQVLTHRLPRAIDLGVVARSGPDRLVVAAGLAPSGLQVTELEAARVTAEHPVGSNPIGWMIKWLYAMQLGLMPLSLGAALVLSRLMLQHRTREIRAGDRRALHATLARRGLAQTIDYGFTAGPVIIAFATKAGEFDRMMDAGWWLERWWLVALSMGLWAAGVIAFAFMEARWGRTPGKWVLGIRVVSLELEPCSFGRALLRNVLEMVDGMFYFVAGLLSIALSEHWQRIGDLAARTVVIEGEPVSEG